MPSCSIVLLQAARRLRFQFPIPDGQGQVPQFLPSLFPRYVLSVPPYALSYVSRPVHALLRKTMRALDHP